MKSAFSHLSSSLPCQRTSIAIALLGLWLCSSLLGEGIGQELPLTELKRVVNRLIESGQLDRAESILKQEHVLKGGSGEILFLEAMLLFEQKRHHESLTKLRACLEKKMETAEVYKLIASNGILLDRLGIVQPALTAAIRLAPDDHLARFHMGMLYYTTSRFAFRQTNTAMTQTAAAILRSPSRNAQPGPVDAGSELAPRRAR